MTPSLGTFTCRESGPRKGKKTKKQKQNKKYPETNDNENITIQNLGDVAKTVLRGKFTEIQAFLKKEEKSQINNLNYHLKELP